MDLPGHPEKSPSPPTTAPHGRPPPLRAFRLRLKVLRSVGLPCRSIHIPHESRYAYPEIIMKCSPPDFP